jgi:hypothetical protein
MSTETSTSAVQLEPMKTIDDWAVFLRTSRRTIERMLSSGKLPPPDFVINNGDGAGASGNRRNTSRWRAETMRLWVTGRTA